MQIAFTRGGAEHRRYWSYGLFYRVICLYHYLISPIGKGSGHAVVCVGTSGCSRATSSFDGALYFIQSTIHNSVIVTEKSMYTMLSKTQCHPCLSCFSVTTSKMMLIYLGNPSPSQASSAARLSDQSGKLSFKPIQPSFTVGMEPIEIASTHVRTLSYQVHY